MEGEQLRNLRDFLLVYNKMTELCFSRCAKNLNYRTLTMDEEQCLDSCASKLIRSNHRLMAAYVGLMPAVVQRRMAEYDSQTKQASIGAAPNTETSLEVSPESSQAPPDGGGTTDVSSAESIQQPQ